MTITNKTIYDAYTALLEISKKEEIPALVGYDLMQVASKMEKQYIILDELRNKLIKKYGKEEKDGRFTVTGENLESFTNEVNELLEKEVEMEFEKLSLERKVFEGIKIRPALFLQLQDVLELV